MVYTKKFTVKEEHIDCQDIMDGLYYPHYMEETRHAFVRDILGFDLETEASNGINMILTEYTMKFKKSLIKDDEFEVDCSAELISPIKVQFNQKITRDGKLITSASFIATCVKASGGRPFILDEVKEKIENQLN